MKWNLILPGDVSHHSNTFIVNMWNVVIVGICSPTTQEISYFPMGCLQYLLAPQVGTHHASTDSLSEIIRRTTRT